MKTDSRGRTPSFIRIFAAVLSVILALSMVVGVIMMFFYS